MISDLLRSSDKIEEERDLYCSIEEERDLYCSIEEERDLYCSIEEERDLYCSTKCSHLPGETLEVKSLAVTFCKHGNWNTYIEVHLALIKEWLESCYTQCIPC